MQHRTPSPPRLVDVATPPAPLPQCRAKRNYICNKCTFYTQNPRLYLLHARDYHQEKIRIYECEQCMYASKHHQKLTRHVKMVHEAEESSVAPNKQIRDSPSPGEDIDDFLEEIEECDDTTEETFANDTHGLMEIDVEGDRSALEGVPSKPKGEYFSCNKCAYVTHIKSRFTKHVKYHSMPMIKCTICEFRTPYKWNLDRHMRNHGGTGNFLCSVCNFTADIKQSLTVHEMNHHTVTTGLPSLSRRRNRVGASDTPPPQHRQQEAGNDDELVAEMGQYADIEMVSCNSESNDATTSEPSAKKDVSHLATDVQGQSSTSPPSEEKKVVKKARPPPPLIPLNSSTPNQSKTGEPPAKKFKENDTLNLNTLHKIENLPCDITLIPVRTTNAKESILGKKNESFFDKLKKRLLTETGEDGTLVCKGCGFESKCLSEHSVHEKNCTLLFNKASANPSSSSVGSTRCQNCRHRCKSSADLVIHMQTCSRSDVIEDRKPEQTNNMSTLAAALSKPRDFEPHPMENVVFVWNNFNNDASKFEMPLDITISEENQHEKSFDCDDTDSMNLSPSQVVGKKVFKCPHCTFWASTASRFHVHIVGHLNKKPFECSLCKYKSNWRWDITKHIKLKSARDPEHNEAKVLMTDETGRRNYAKYTKFMAMPVMDDNGVTEFHYIDPDASNLTSLPLHFGQTELFNESMNQLNAMFDMPLNLQTHCLDGKLGQGENRDDLKKKKTLWKCKKCNYKDPSKQALLEHVREHTKEELAKKTECLADPADLAYRCGHCNQLSNWKHVIQRHCRLKHEGIIKVITTVKPKSEALPTTIEEITSEACLKCPYRSNDKHVLLAHMQQHQPSDDSIFKCYFCPFFVKNESELVEHLLLHGVNDPEDYIAKAKGCTFPLPDTNEYIADDLPGPPSVPGTNKRHKCSACPYETNSKSQYMYHEQFHKLTADTPYKCPECNYSVSKRHLLNQHLRVHGILVNKNEFIDDDKDSSINIDEIPFVWVSAKNEFHKMYKCRYCSYVNSQKCKIPNHEKIHCITSETSEIAVYKCLECKFTCDGPIKLAEHSKAHGEIYGRIYCAVEENVPDEEQIAKLRKVIESERQAATENAENGTDELKEDRLKILFFCQKCPARFFSSTELKMHDKFHDLSFSNKCYACEFSLPQESQLNLHMLVHSDEYNTKTKMLKFVHNSHPSHRAPHLKFIKNDSEVVWIVPNPGKNKKSSDSKSTPKQYYCKECPAKFFKTSALNYHAGLHGGEGDHKCKKCSYTVKNVGNLAKHELLHEAQHMKPEPINGDYDSGDDVDYKDIPISGTDLFQRKTEANKRGVNNDKLVRPNDHFPPPLQADPQFGYLMHGNPEFIYPTYFKNGRQKEKRYKCHKCPSAFEKREQYKIHLSLHGSKQRYKCELCDYSVKYYANYVQHMRKHQMNDEALADRKKSSGETIESETVPVEKTQDTGDNVKLAIKTMPKCTLKSDFQQYSISDQQTLRIMQHRRSHGDNIDLNATEGPPAKERKLHLCILCPYSNQRQDALVNHYRRHDETDVVNVLNAPHANKCNYCDIIVVQSHFLRDHLKSHFNYLKTLTPECFVANEDISFQVSKIDENDVITDMTLDSVCETNCGEDKIYVKLLTGELYVE